MAAKIPKLPVSLGLVIGSSIAIPLVYAIVKQALQVPARIVPSPRTKVGERLTREEQDGLAYPPNAFPGARDVISPVC
jgi:hypothetical protein